MVRTCRISSFCTVAWQLARFQLTRRIVRSLGDTGASCLFKNYFGSCCTTNNSCYLLTLDMQKLAPFIFTFCSPSGELAQPLVSSEHTHTRLTALCPGLPGWVGSRKVKPMWILLKQETASGSGVSWAICKSASRSRQITMPAPHYFSRGSYSNQKAESLCLCACFCI